VTGFVDLHSHVLFGVDDGAIDISGSRDLLLGLAGVGFTEICATPHQKDGQYLPSLDLIRERFAEVRMLPGAPHLRLGAENMWDDVFLNRLQSNTIPSYDDGPAFLVEIRPSDMPPNLADHLFKLRLAGRVPVLAHPERYAALWNDDDLVQRLRKVCAFVVDLGAVAGAHGKHEAKAARRFIDDGIAHAAASDTHVVGDLKLAAEGIAWIRKRRGDAVVTRLLAEAPRAILAGELPD
jgi:protein-tyrosine phosphatase